MADLAEGRITTDDFVQQSLRGVQRSQGTPGAVDALDSARTQIAKTYGVQNALNPATGTVDARKLANQLAKGKPLSGGLLDAAEFAARFPKAAQTPEMMGSLPGTSPLDFAMSLATKNKLAALATLGARPAARSLALSPLIQNRLVQSQGSTALQNLLADPRLAQLGYQVAPNALDDR
jgi:hypothetical protein